MDTVPFEAFARNAREYDVAVGETADIDRFCSSSAWILPASAAFHGDRVPEIARSGAGWLAVAREVGAGSGRLRAPLEAMWGLASPLAGPDAARLARDAGGELDSRMRRGDLLQLSGLRRDSTLFRELVARLDGSCEIRVGPKTLRWAASLAGGYGGWLGRRTRKFRANLRRALAKARDERVAIEVVDRPSVPGARALYERILAVEARSWKGRRGAGFAAGDMRTFYGLMVPWLAAEGRLRALFATRDGQDLAFHFGGVLGDTYRGLQMSYDDGFASLSLGNVLQSEMIGRLAEAGTRVYDLGSDMAYKANWGERGLETVMLLACRRG
ncbi:MAG: GNAT family N-acetyltransferase [Planctomycetes bacterium]|nr:GNAT family N-acetyltransferase [Planctomycetota bacterium]